MIPRSNEGATPSSSTSTSYSSTATTLRGFFAFTRFSLQVGSTLLSCERSHGAPHRRSAMSVLADVVNGTGRWTIGHARDVASILCLRASVHRTGGTTHSSRDAVHAVVRPFPHAAWPPADRASVTDGSGVALVRRAVTSAVPETRCCRDRAEREQRCRPRASDGPLTPHGRSDLRLPIDEPRRRQLAGNGHSGAHHRRPHANGSADQCTMRVWVRKSAASRGQGGLLIGVVLVVLRDHNPRRAI